MDKNVNYIKLEDALNVAEIYARRIESGECFEEIKEELKTEMYISCVDDNTGILNDFKCYAIIDKDTNKFLKTSYELYIPFYKTYEQAKNGLRGYKSRYKTNIEGYQIVEITIKDKNIKILEEN